MSIRLKQFVLTALFFGLMPGPTLLAQDASIQENGAGMIAPGGGGFQALSGAEAAFFVLPDDVNLVSSRRLERYSLTYERYQQVFGNAMVLGGQLTLLRNDAGDITTVIGAHYPGIVPTNVARLAAAEARGIVDRDIGPTGQRITDLMIDPRSGRYFFQVETRRADSRWILWIGAQNGRVFNKYNALMHQTCSTDPTQPSCGIGVEYDVGFPNDVKDLNLQTSWSDTYGAYMLWSQNDRRGTYDFGASTIFTIPIAKDLDDVWDSIGDESPYQQAMVDSHYYAYVTDTYFDDTYGFDWVLEGMANGMKYDFMAMFAHHNGAGANNAFWNGSNVSLGDGDQVNFREFTSLDVVAHEITHGVTDFTSDLIYQNESGALNEAFSDIMAAGAEHYADFNGMEPAANQDPVLFAPDFLVGEDIDLRGIGVPGIRNMGDPEEDSTTLPGPEIVTHPDHYLERYTGSNDNGGVHINSGIPNHAYFLLVNGGLNASCADLDNHNSDHCEAPDPDLFVNGIGIADAEQIFFMAFTALNSTATMCDARLASEAAALSLTPIDSNLTIADMAQSSNDAWNAVGLTDSECGPIGGAPTASFTYTCTSLTCTFDASGSSDPDGTIVTYDWNFGDGNSGSGVAPGNHTFAAANSYTVVLTVTDNEGATDTDTQTVTVSGASSLLHIGDLDGAGVSAPRNRWNAVVTVTVHDAGDLAVPGAIVSGSWSSGANGGGSCETDVSGQCDIIKSNLKGNVASVAFTVDDMTGPGSYDPGANPVGDSIVVFQTGGNQSPTASFTYGCTSLTCTFGASGSSDPDGTIVTYDWNFGDGNSGSGVAPGNHTYAAANSYTVVLTVTDNEGATDTDTQTVTASGASSLLHIGDLDGAGVSAPRNRWNAVVTVTVHDASDLALPGAVVSGSWSNGANGGAECTTDGGGQCSVTKNNIKGNASSVTFTVNDAAKPGYSYAAGANHNSEGDSDGTSITVLAP